MTASDSSGGAAEAFIATTLDTRTADRTAMRKILAMTGYSFRHLELLEEWRVQYQLARNGEVVAAD